MQILLPASRVTPDLQTSSRGVGNHNANVSGVLRVLIDTSTWLDLAKRRDGQRLIVPIRVLAFQGRLDLLVPQVVIDEFERNRPRVEASMTSEVTQRFKLIRRDLVQYGSDHSEALEMLDQLAHQVPLIGAMTTRNFEEIREQLDRGSRIEPTADDQARVVARGLTKAAPFHRSKNGTADALLIELFSTVLASAGKDDRYAFVTSNSEDFSAVGGDNRQPHAELAQLFAGEHSTYRLGVEGLEQALAEEFGEEWPEIVEENYFEEEPRRLDEILAAEQEMFDKVWYERSMRHDRELTFEGKQEELERHRSIARSGRKRVENAYGAENLDPQDNFEIGMLNGKLSALRWVLGSEWDFLDT